MVRITMEDGGIIDIELNEEVAPITCENFKKLVKEGFFWRSSPPQSVH